MLTTRAAERARGWHLVARTAHGPAPNQLGTPAGAQGEAQEGAAAMTDSADAADPRVDACIAALPAWQQTICRQVRALVHAADTEVAETVKRTDRPYFVLQGNIAALQATKDHVNIFLYDGGLTPDPEGLITGGHGNATGRTIALHQGETLDAPAFTAMIRHLIATNRAGGWRQVKRGERG